MLSIGADESLKPLNEAQDNILSEFFNRYIGPDLRTFIQFGTPEKTLVRAFLVFSTYYLSEHNFLIHLNLACPASPEDTDTAKQLNYLRNKLINLCSLCHESIDINHTLYQWVFDNRLADSPQSSPVKKKMVRNALFHLIQNQMLELGFTYSDCLASPSVSNLRKLAEPVRNQEDNLRVRRQLFY